MRQSEIREKYVEFSETHKITQTYLSEVIGVERRTLNQFRLDKADLPEAALKKLAKFMVLHNKTCDAVNE